MKYCVGFQLLDGERESFSGIVEAYAPHISEVFFSWQDIASGRSAVATCHGYTDWSAELRDHDLLRFIYNVNTLR